jgi:hypothetical protein
MRVDNISCTSFDKIEQGKYNQDYSGVYHDSDDNCIIAVADGCSTGDRTELGSSLLINIILDKNFIKYNTSYFLSRYKIAYDFLKNFGYKKEDLFSTLLSLHIDKDDEYITASIFGDGFLVIKYNDGNFDIYCYDSSNIPIYPIYLLYANTPYKLKILLNRDNFFVNEDKPFSEILFNTKFEFEKKSYSLEDSTPFIKKIHKKDIDYILLFTDGIDRIYNKNENGIYTDKLNVFDAITQFMNIKNFNGNFIQRSVIYNRNLLKKKGYYLLDDLTIAGVKF